MNTICTLDNPIQNYVWGSKTAIPELLGQKPSGVPQAELWMGAHPKAPSKLMWNGESVSLSTLIARYPKEILGQSIAERFNNTLPFLFKVLAAARPLSIQAHPDRQQALLGFERENGLSIPLNAPDRNYRDPNHKPECICALTPFWALRGFRRISDILLRLMLLCPEGLEMEIRTLENNQEAEGLKQFFKALMTMGRVRKPHIIAEVVTNAGRLSDQGDRSHEWVLALHREYPHDIGILSPAILNLICLKPGEAMFLGPGELHAYLDGVGIEIMANSDNVLRGGLTPKHVDVGELLKVLHFTEREIDVLLPVPIGRFESLYETEAVEFSLSVIALTGTDEFKSGERRSVEILICTDGNAQIIVKEPHHYYTVSKGNVHLIPAASPSYTIKGTAVIYKASVPL